MPQLSLGWLPLGWSALVVGCHIAACRVFASPRPARDRVVATMVLVPAMMIALVRVLGAFHGLTSAIMFVATLVLSAALALVSGASARSTARADLRNATRIVREALVGGPWSLCAWVGIVAIALSAWAAWLLEPWAWDALGYHLPIVHDALQTGVLREVPTGVPYVNVYPRAVEMTFVWWRLLLPNDTWLDFAQAPFAFGSIAVIAAISSRSGVKSSRAVATALLFAAVPVAMLQLAADYVDIAYACLLLLSAYFVTASISWTDAVFTGLAMGMLLGAKPTAPPAITLLCVAYSLRAWKTKAINRAVIAILIAVAVGGERYISNLIIHHNPVWPVDVRIGPLHFNGVESSRYFFNLGVPEPYLHYGWLRRLLSSWFIAPRSYIYDMRIGGFGPLFSYVLVPIVVLFAWRNRAREIALPTALVLLCALATPGAFCARYTLAITGAFIAFASVATAQWSVRSRAGWDLFAAALAVFGIVVSIGGFTDGGPSLVELARMTPAARRRSVSVDGHAQEWQAARDLVHDGDAFGYDRGFGLPGQLWRADGRGRIAYLPDTDRGIAQLLEWVRREHVPVVALGFAPDGAEPAARTRPDVFVEMFRCPVDPCTVFRVIDGPQP